MNKKSMSSFDADLLDRARYAQNLEKIISICERLPKSNDNEAFVIGIDSPWGTGKTFFIKMLEDYLKSKNGGDNCLVSTEKNIDDALRDTKYEVVYYDAWENDFWDNAFEPLFDKLVQVKCINREAEKRDIVDLWKSTAKIIALGVKGIISKVLEDSIDNSVITEMIDEFKNLGENAFDYNYQTSELFPQYSHFKLAIEALREYLSFAVKSCGAKIVVIIDELDRCKPMFAVQTLEIVKHLFNIEGLVFIFALDVSQLAHCVKNVYGEEMDAIGYLERFFNYITMLPVADADKIINHYCDEFGIYISDGNVRDRLNEISKMFALSLRDIRTIFCALCILQQTTLLEYKDIANAQILYFYFLCMKYKKPDILKKAVIMNDYTELEMFVKTCNIPFIGDFDGKREGIIKILTSKNMIKETKFYAVKNNKVFCDEVLNVNGEFKVELMIDDNKEINIANDSLSFILFYPDVIKWDSIKGYSLVEYIYRQIEQCDFITEN